jgi:hypothetical protein
MQMAPSESPQPMPLRGAAELNREDDYSQFVSFRCRVFSFRTSIAKANMRPHQDRSLIRGL